MLWNGWKRKQEEDAVANRMSSGGGIGIERTRDEDVGSDAWNVDVAE
jgi:hypothetical protein